MTVDRAVSDKKFERLADAETLEMIYRAEEDPLRKAQIRKQLEEMRKQVETRV